jgi:agmatine/peptidylarginine deiminase
LSAQVSNFCVTLQRTQTTGCILIVYIWTAEKRNSLYSLLNLLPMQKYYASLPLILLVAQMGFAQDAVLPKGLTEAEKLQLSTFSFRRQALSPPPETPVRAAAEWEEVEYLVITWVPAYQNILRQIVAVGVTECKVIVTTDNAASVSAYLASNGIPLDNVIFMNAPYDSIWIRDYGGNTVYSNAVGERALTDWIYNRPRPSDNVMPSAHAALVGVPIYVTDTGLNDLVNTGGNYMSDGLGNAFASELILEENEAGNPYGVSAKTEEEIDGIMQSYMGISNYIKMPVLPYDGIHHIDMHMKLLDEETLLVARYPAGVADGPQIEANLAEVLANEMSPFGTPYKVYRIDSPPSAGGLYQSNGGAYRTFTNSVFVNGSILIPLYRPEVDVAALAIYQQLLPGYNVVGIDVDNAGENLINSSGAIHCITHTIGVADPLWIVHQPVASATPGSTVAINAMIRHGSGIAAAAVFWREMGTANWNALPMIGLADNVWTTDLPIPANGNDVEYYIHATAVSGKELSRPIVAPDGYWTIVTEQLSAEDWASAHISQPYPNPARDRVSVNLDRIDGRIAVSVSDVLGQRLSRQTFEGGTGTISVDLSRFAAGTLLLTFDGDFGRVTRKIVKL